MVVDPVKSRAVGVPHNGGRLRVAVNGQGTEGCLDPATFSRSMDFILGALVYSGLTRVDETGEAVPELAESYESNRQATEWLVTLRKDVGFHDGKALEATDVVGSLLRHKDEKLSSTSKGLVSEITDVAADGRTKVRISLSAPNADLPLVLASPGLAIVSSETTDFGHPNGTGPFLLRDLKPGTYARAIRNDAYFKPGQPYLDEVECRATDDTESRLNSLASGEVDIISDLPQNLLHRLQGHSEVRILSNPCRRFVQVTMMCDRDPTASLDLRLAIKSLLDRQRVVDEVFKGHAAIANDHLVLASSPLFDASIEQRTIDHDRARYHLRKAGFERGRLDLSVCDSVPGSMEIGQILQQEASHVGLTLNVIREPVGRYYSDVWMQRPLHAVFWNPKPSYNIASYGMMARALWRSDAKWNDTRLRDAKLDQVLDMAMATTDLLARKQLFSEIQRTIYERGGNGIPAFVNVVDAHSAKVKGLKSAPTGVLGGLSLPDEIWLKLSSAA